MLKQIQALPAEAPSNATGLLNAILPYLNKDPIQPDHIIKILLTEINVQKAAGCSFDAEFINYLESAAKKNYTAEDIGIVLQACDEAYRVAKKYIPAPAPVAGAGLVAPAMVMAVAPVAVVAAPITLSDTAPANCLGNQILTMINEGGDNAKNAIEAIFNILTFFKDTDYENFKDKLRDLLNIADNNDKWIDRYKEFNAETNPEKKEKLKQALNQEFIELCKNKIGPAHLNHWRDLLNSFPVHQMNNGDPNRHNTVSIFERSFDSFGVDSKNINDDYLAANLNKNISEYYFYNYKGKTGKQLEGPYGGFYLRPFKTADNKFLITKILFKQDPTKEKNYTESLVGGLKRLLVDDFAAATFLANAPDKQIYAASINFVPYTPVWQLAGLPKRPNVILDPGDFAKIDKTLDDLIAKGIPGFEESMIGSWWTDDGDPHSDNIGQGSALNSSTLVIRNIDHGGAIPRGLKPTVNPHAFIFEPGKPPNQIRSYAEHLRVSTRMVSAIDHYFSRLTYDNLKQTIFLQLQKQAALNETDTFINYAKLVLGEDEYNKYILPTPPAPSVPPTIANLKTKLETFVPDVMFARAQSMRNFSLQMKYSFCFKYENGAFVLDNSKYNLDEIIKSNPNYFLAARMNRKFYHFRGINNGKKLGDRTDLGNRYGNKEIEKQIEEKLDQYLKDQNITGLEKLLHADFDNNPNIPQLAEIYLERLRLFNLIAPDSQFTDLILFIDKWKTQPDVYSEHLTQLFDQAYQAMIKKFSNMPISVDKMKLYQLFDLTTQPSVAEKIKTIENARKSYAADKNYPANFNIDNCAFTREIEDSLMSQYRLAESSRYNAAAWQHISTIESTTKQLKDTLDSISRIHPNPHPKSALNRAQERYAKTVATITHAKQHHQNKTYSTEQLYHYKYDSKLKPIPITILPNKTAFESLQDTKVYSQLMSNSPSAASTPTPPLPITLQGSKPADISHVEAAVTEQTAIFCPNPIDTTQKEDNIKSGCLISKTDTTTTIEEVMEAKQMSLAHILTKLLTSQNLHIKAIGHTNSNPKIDELTTVLQEHYINHLQSSYPPQTITVDNLTAFLNEASERELLNVETKFLVRSTEDIAKKIISALDQKLCCRTQPMLPHEDYLAWAYFWFSTLKADPNINLRDVTISHSKGNPKFVEALLIIAAAEGANPNKANKTGYEINIKPAQIEAYKKIMANPSDATHQLIKSKVRTLESEVADAMFANKQSLALGH